MRWQLRAGGAILAIAGVAILSLAHAANLGWEFYILNVLIFAAATLTAYELAAVSRKNHVTQAQHRRAQSFVDTLELQDPAMRDDLTQLFNRGYFFERLEREVERSRSLQCPLAVLVLDVDRLEGINEAYGRQTGDAALAKLAKVILKCTRATDIPARLGDDEFGVTMPETDRRGAFVVATRIRRMLEVTSVCERDGQSIKLTVSLGVSGFPWDGQNGDELVQKADGAMYVVKATRRGTTDAPEPTPSEAGLTG
ncbi:MAG: GGDEF domain-containing protein [Dehalococcoidia bacterium]|nr:MAG: GGDEF domain-containing protein [Dehalococcoidia bacterium]